MLTPRIHGDELTADFAVTALESTILNPSTRRRRSGALGRMRFPPKGLGGGTPGSLSRIEVNGEAIGLTGSPNLLSERSDVIHLSLPGGGYGNPSEQSRNAIETDLMGGCATLEDARRYYGYETKSEGIRDVRGSAD